MWEPRCLTILWASTAWYRDSFYHRYKTVTQQKKKEKKGIYLSYNAKEPIMYQSRHFARLQSTGHPITVYESEREMFNKRKEEPNQATPLKTEKLQTLQGECKRYIYSHRNTPVRLPNNFRSAVTPLGKKGMETKEEEKTKRMGAE
jgi:hypothetical protein